MDQSYSVYKKIVENMEDGVLALDASGIITLMNPTARIILGLSPRALGQSFRKVFDLNEKNDELLQMIIDAVLTKDTVKRYLINYEFHGNTKKLSVTATRIHDEAEATFLVFHDMTDVFSLKNVISNQEKLFARYMSGNVARKILDDPHSLDFGGDIKEVTILMSDLRGFTALSEKLSPEELISVLNQYLVSMTRIINRFGGTIIEFVGDSVFALFGQPTADKFHASHAVECAICMQNAMDNLMETMGLEDSIIEMGIGIHTGSVVLGNIGGDQRMKYGVVGKTVNVAGRIEGCTVGGQILVSSDTYHLLKNPLSKAEMSVHMKGISGQITLYDIVREGRYTLKYNKYDLIELDTPISAKMSIMNGKYISELWENVEILAQSDKTMRLSTRKPILTDIYIMFGTKHLYAKYISEDIICITGYSNNNTIQ